MDKLCRNRGRQEGLHDEDKKNFNQGIDHGREQ
jgi:hypothetical protein